MSRIHQAIAATALLLASLAQANAQTRTWVSGVGDDANPCARTAPCKTFAGAMSKTAAGGDINVLDPGGFGAVTITKSLSITDNGTGMGGIAATFVNGVIVNAGVNDVVVLRGLIIDGFGTGLNGIRFLAGAALHIENCVIRNFRGAAPNGAGILIAPGAANTTSKIIVSNCTIINNNKGIEVMPTGTAIAKVILDRLQINRNIGAGIISDGRRSDVFVNASFIASNTPGVSSINNGTMRSFGNNTLVNNVPDGNFTGDLTQQ